MCIHNYKTVYEQGKYKYVECKWCNKRKTIEKFVGGYQPKKYPNWDK